MTKKCEVDFTVVQGLYHLPIEDAARTLGVCVTTLKKICRENGVLRWPHQRWRVTYEKAVNQTPNAVEDASAFADVKVMSNGVKAAKATPKVNFPIFKHRGTVGYRLSKGNHKAARQSSEERASVSVASSSVAASPHHPSSSSIAFSSRLQYRAEIAPVALFGDIDFNHLRQRFLEFGRVRGLVVDSVRAHGSFQLVTGGPSVLVHPPAHALPQCSSLLARAPVSPISLKDGSHQKMWWHL